MKNVIILHGLTGESEYYNPQDSSGSNAHWLPWLQKQMLTHDMKADTPEVPRPFDAEWESWAREVERFDIGPETSLVGHSMGGGFWVRYLSEHPELYVDKVILVAPWLDVEKTLDKDFFTFEIGTDVCKRANKFVIFESDNDGAEIKASIQLLKEKIPEADIRTFHNYGHFCLNDMKTDEFPELRDALIMD